MWNILILFSLSFIYIVIVNVAITAWQNVLAELYGSRTHCMGVPKQSPAFRMTISTYNGISLANV